MDVGSRSNMEDVYVCADNMMNDYGFSGSSESLSALYGVCNSFYLYTNLIFLYLSFGMWNRSYSWMW